MSQIAHKRGTWINQYAQPSAPLFLDRVKDVDYVIIKWGLSFYEQLARQSSKPWLAEIMGDSGVGSQNGPANAVLFATRLANQANQPGCVGAVINLEEADGGWHTDTGAATRLLITTFRRLAPGKPLFSSLDTRGNRPDYAYQRVCAELCEGVMPMVYPQAFEQTAERAFASAINALMLQKWAGKEIIPTFQTYGPTDVSAQTTVLRCLHTAGVIVGANSYTLGHATQDQWLQSLTFLPKVVPPPADLAAGLIALRQAWVKGWHQIEQHGNVGEAVAYAAYWQRLTGQT